MKKSLFQKIFFSVAIALIIIIILIMILLSVSVNNYLVNDKKQLLTDNCNTISGVLTEQNHDSINFHVSLQGMMSVVSKAVKGEAYVCDSKGNVFICSCADWTADQTCVHSKSTIPRDILDSTTNEGFFEVGNLNKRFSSMYYTAGTPFYSPKGELRGYVYISSPASYLRDMWSELADIYIFCAAIPIAALFIFLYVLSKRMTKPINLMSQASVKMAKGDFSQRIPVKGDDEIANLAETFNAMANSLSQLEGMRRSFIANVSHELRTPMTTIGGFIDGILDGTIPPEKQEHYLGIVSTEVKRLSRLVQSMLSLARLESGEQKPNPTEFKILDLSCDILLSQEQRIESKNINIEGLDQGSDIKVFADRDLIYQAIFNLVDNAIKFTPDGGTISVKATEDNVGNVSFSIRNDGKGIKPEELQYIFDRFYKSDKARSANKDGTGLGLYITKTIVDIHHGNITVSSQPDSFTEFAIIIPRIEQ